jgi:hypothetical protein
MTTQGYQTLGDLIDACLSEDLALAALAGRPAQIRRLTPRRGSLPRPDWRTCIWATNRNRV